MTREEFSEKLKEARTNNKVNIKQLCYALDVLSSAVYNIEKASNNYGFARAIKYAHTVGVRVVVSENRSIDSAEDAIRFLREMAGSSQLYVLAPQIGCTGQALTYALNGKTALSIDMFLRLCDHFNVTVSIVPKPE